MVPVAQWWSASLWMRRLWVRPPSGTQNEKPISGLFCLCLSIKKDNILNRIIDPGMRLWHNIGIEKCEKQALMETSTRSAG